MGFERAGVIFAITVCQILKRNDLGLEAGTEDTVMANMALRWVRILGSFMQCELFPAQLRLGAFLERKTEGSG